MDSNDRSKKSKKYLFFRWTIILLFVMIAIFEAVERPDVPLWVQWVGNVFLSFSFIVPGTFIMFMPKHFVIWMQHLVYTNPDKYIEWEQLRPSDQRSFYIIAIIAIVIGLTILVPTLSQLLRTY